MPPCDIAAICTDNHDSRTVPFTRNVFQRVGMDLHRVTFPTFVLEPRSMLERITDFMSHPELIFGYVWHSGICAVVIGAAALLLIVATDPWVFQR